MILDAIIHFLYSFLVWITGFLPSTTLLPDFVGTSFNTIFYWVGKADYFIPVLFLAKILLFWLTWQFVSFTWHGLVFVGKWLKP
jgi:hypothetical protein